MPAGEIRSIYAAIRFVDEATKPLKQVNQAMDNARRQVESVVKVAENARAKYLYMSQAFEQSLAQTRFFFSQMDLAAKEAMIRTKYAAKPVQDLAMAFERVKMKVREYSDAVKSRLQGATDAIERHKEAILAIGAGLSAIGYGGFRFFKEATKDLADFQDAMRVFRIRAGENADAILKAMEEAAGGTIDSTQLILNANRAMVMGIDPQYLPKMMEIARAAARNMGMDVQYMFESIVLGTARQSKLILDNLGIIIKSDEAYERYAKTLGKTVSQLTEAEKRQAFLNAVMEAGEDIVKHTDLSQESLNEEIQRATVAWKEFKKELAKGALPVISKFVDGVKAATQWLRDLPRPVKAVVGTLGVLTTIIAGTVGPLMLHAAAIGYIAANYAQIKAGLVLAKTAILSFTGSVWAAIAPLLPFIAIIAAVVGAILLLQDVLVKGWEKSYLGKFVSWLLDRFPMLKALAEIVSREIAYLKSAFDWLSNAIGRVVAWIQQALDTLGPMKYFILGPAGALLLLAQNFDKLKAIATSALTTLKSVWGSTIGWIINKISEFITAIQNAWKAITENPLFKAAQTILRFTPAGMGLTAARTAYTAITEHRVTIPELPKPPTISPTAISTFHQPTYIKQEHRTIHVPKIDIKIEGVKDPDKVAEIVKRKLGDELRTYGY